MRLKAKALDHHFSIPGHSPASSRSASVPGAADRMSKPKIPYAAASARGNRKAHLQGVGCPLRRGRRPTNLRGSSEKPFSRKYGRERFVTQSAMLCVSGFLALEVRRPFAVTWGRGSHERGELPGYWLVFQWAPQIGACCWEASPRRTLKRARRIIDFQNGPVLARRLLEVPLWEHLPGL